jgi:hypothetical protein
VVFAVQYPLPTDQGLATGAKVGIGVGTGVGVIAIIGLASGLLWRRKHNKDKKPFVVTQPAVQEFVAEGEAIGVTGSASGQGQSFIRPPLDQQSVRRPGNFVSQGAYNPAPQMRGVQGYNYSEMEDTSHGGFHR